VIIFDNTCTVKQRHNFVFFTGRMPFLPPTNNVKALKTTRETSTVLMAYQLPSQQWHILNDGKSDAPFWILCQFNDGRQYAL